VITTGYILAKIHGEEEIEVFWPLNYHLPVHFQDLFTDLPHGRVVERDVEPRVLADYETAQAQLPSDYRNSALYREMLRRVLDCTVPEVVSEVSEFVAAHFHGTQKGSGPIGVHIRRSEKPYPICPYAQPLRYYEAIMRGLAEDTRFFVSTDSQEAFWWLSRRFGDRVFQRSKLHDNRSELGGVREGLVDMLLLSRCSGIIGTFGSSFSGMASRVEGRPILRVKTNLQVPAGWPSFSSVQWLWSYRHFFVESTFWQRWLYYSARPTAGHLYHALVRRWLVLYQRHVTSGNKA